MGFRLGIFKFLKIKTDKTVYNFPFIFTKSEKIIILLLKKRKLEETKNKIGNFDQFKLMYEFFFSNNINHFGLTNSLLKTYNLLFKILNNF